MNDAASAGERRSAGIRRSGLAGIVAKGVGAGLSFLLLPVLVRSLGRDTYGAYAAATTVAMFLNWSDLGVGLALVSRLAKASSESDADAARLLVANTWSIMWVLAVILVPLGAVSSWIVPWPSLINAHIPAHEIQLALDLYLATTFLGVPAGIGLRIMQAHQQGVGANLWVLCSTSAGAVVPVLLAVSHVPFWAVLASSNVAMLMVNGTQTAAVFRRNRHLLPKAGDLAFTTARRTLGSGTLFLTLNLVVAFAYQADTLVISSVLGARYAAVFATSAKPFALLFDLAAIYNLQLWPAIAEANARGDTAWVQDALWKSTRRMGMIALPILLIVVVAWRPLVGILFGQGFTPPWSLVIALGVWTFQQIVGNPVAMVLNGLSIVGFQVVASVIMGAANLGLSIVLAHQIGVSGPVWASVVTHAALLLIPSLGYAMWFLPRRLQREAAVNGIA